MTNRKYLITSANSYGNVGDDVCGYGAEYLVRTIDPSADTTVTRPPYREELVDRADVIIVGGGGVIYDTDMANVENYMRYIERGIEKNKVTAVLGVGFQGIGTDEGKSRYRSTLSAADVTTVRSPVDKRLLDDIDTDGVITTQDLGFLTDEWVKSPSFLDGLRIKKTLKKNSKPNLGLAVVDLVAIKGDAFDEKSANFVDSLNDNLDRMCEDFNVYLLVHSADDAKYYAELARKYPVTVVGYKTVKDLPFFWAIYQKMDLIIGSRFHSVILGCLAKKPVISISSESTKQNRLANYDMPTLLGQRLLFSDMAGVKDLFMNLKKNFDAGKYKVATDEEITLAKKRAHKNGELLKAAIEAKA